jgi:hypothetical protein
LICDATGIAAVQYPGETTLHSLFRLGIDKQFTGSFGSNIGRGTVQARHILAADMIVVDEVSMLTPWVAIRVSMTLQSISDHDRIEFGGKRILFVGDLLQLPPVVPNFSMPVLYRLIARLLYWRSIQKFQLRQPLRHPDPVWADFLHSVAHGQTQNIQDWREFHRRFRVTATKDVQIAQSVFGFGLQPDDPFPLNRQWICATNKLVN